MRHYETTFILRPNLGEDQFTEIIERTSAIITDDGGTIINTDRWGIKRLAYEIKKEVQGYYVNLNYAAPGKTINEIERIFRIDDRLLRYLTIKLADAMDQDAITREQDGFAARAAAVEADEAETTGETATETSTKTVPTEETVKAEGTVTTEKTGEQEEKTEATEKTTATE
ncbi:MAG: 30S ribosomal protein S6 [Desulfobulbaceae bacterium]|nr:30S ribosomal protein S6 [Desulfobulbaceae bacterium]